MFIILKVTIKIERRSNVLYVKVYFIAINNSRYYIYAANPPQILVSGYYLKVHI